jgi:hypothetical protein
MKTILTVLIILFSFNAKSQTNCDSLQIRMNLAGSEFMKFHQTYGIGSSVFGSGIAVSILGSLLSENGKISPVLYLGSAATLAGVIIMVAAHDHIKKASLYMIDEKTRIGLNAAGIGITREF